MKTSSEILDAINALELRFPVASWRAGDIDLWPIYRFRLYGHAIDGLLLTQAPPNAFERWRRLADRAARALWRVPLAAWQDRGANDRLRSGTAAVFFSDGVSFTQLDGRWFDRVVDPVMQALDARGLHGLKLTPLAEAHVPRLRSSRFVQPTIDRIKLLATRRQPPPLHLPQFDAFEHAARASFGPLVPSRAWLQVQATRLEALAAWFGTWLDRSGARHAFVNTFYSLEGQAVVQAARRRGLHSIDLQHGMQGPHHAAYARWPVVPDGGYSTLPDEFWVWGDEEAKAIDNWSGKLPRHRPRITGNYWLQRWRDDSDPLIAACLAKARALRAPAATQVLVCLSWGLADGETEKLLQAARLCDASVAWWWRLHPVESSRRAEFAARLRQHGLDGSRVGTTTDLPLYALVRSADLTVSHSSTVTLEAAELGIPSVVTSDYGAELHAALIQSGMAVKATQARSIADAVQLLATRPRGAASACAPAGLLQAAVDELFQCAPAANTHLEAANT